MPSACAEPWALALNPRGGRGLRCWRPLATPVLTRRDEVRPSGGVSGVWGGRQAGWDGVTRAGARLGCMMVRCGWIRNLHCIS
eukprot:92428-Chlamydomonas_euryale.AAC.6